MKSRRYTAADELKQLTQKLTLRYLGGYLGFGEEPEEGTPQVPKLVNRRLMRGSGRFGVTLRCGSGMGAGGGRFKAYE